MLGAVTQNSARVMIETNRAVNGLKVIIKYMGPRSNVRGWRDKVQVIFKQQQEYTSDELDIKEQDQVLVINTNAARPTVFHVDNLRSNSVYSLAFDRTQLEHPDQDKSRPYCNIVTLPKHSNLRSLRTMVVSCNFLGPFKKKKHDHRYQKNSLWEKIYNDQIKDKYYLDMVFHIGDQVYTDNNLALVKPHEKCKAIIGERKVSELSTDDFDAIREEMRKMYRQTWGFKYMRRVTSSVCNYMIWDDHEIRDNYGSREDDTNHDSVQFFLATICRETYWEYQRGLREDVIDYNSVWNRHEGYFVVNKPVGALLFDSRCGRSFLRDADAESGGYPYYGREQWKDVESWMAGQGPLNDPEIIVLFVIFTVPLAFISHRLTNNLSGSVEDLNDHLSHPKHQAEQLKALNMIYDWKMRVENRQVILLGGDAHIGGYTDIRKDGHFFCRQLTTSPVSNPPAPWFVKAGIRMLLRSSDQIGNSWSYHHHKWIGKRNAAILDVKVKDSKNRDLAAPELTSYILTRKGKVKPPAPSSKNTNKPTNNIEITPTTSQA
jgi:hypothetical protein